MLRISDKEWQERCCRRSESQNTEKSFSYLLELRPTRHSARLSQRLRRSPVVQLVESGRFSEPGWAESNPMKTARSRRSATITLVSPLQVEENGHRELQRIQCDPGQPWSRLRPAVPSHGSDGRFTEKTFVIHLYAPSAYLELRHFAVCNGQNANAFDRCHTQSVKKEVQGKAAVQ